MKRFLKLILGLMLWVFVGYVLLHVTYRVMAAASWFWQGRLTDVFLLILNFFIIGLLIKIYKYLKELLVWRKRGGARGLLIKEVFIRIGFLWIIFVLLHLSVVDSYKKGVEPFLECSSSTHAFKGKVYEIQVCESPEYYSRDHLKVIRLNVLDEKKSIVAVRNFVYSLSEYSEGKPPIAYLEDRIEYGPEKKAIKFPVSCWERVKVNSPIISLWQFGQYISFVWRNL